MHNVTKSELRHKAEVHKEEKVEARCAALVSAYCEAIEGEYFVFNIYSESFRFEN